MESHIRFSQIVLHLRADGLQNIKMFLRLYLIVFSFSVLIQIRYYRNIQNFGNHSYALTVWNIILFYCDKLNFDRIKIIEHNIIQRGT